MKQLPLRLTIFVFTLSVGMLSNWTFLTPAREIGESNLDQTSPLGNPAAISEPAPETTPEAANASPDDTRIEYFTDDRRIGRRKENKIEMRCFSRGADRFADIRFFTRTEYGAWLETQSFRFDKDGVTGCNPMVEDFNNDGLLDFTYESNVAARGANEVRKLFIYDKELDELVYIKNSEDFPNLAYNKKLNCIDAFLVYGATSTVFLRIHGDILREFASVSTGEERIVTVTDSSGNKHVLSRKKMDPNNFGEVYWRFETFAPPK